MNRPIFIVGSPRSGTSILTWCLGQHSNIFVQEESNWIGRFAVQVGAAYEVGTARGDRSQLSALGVQRAEFFTGFGANINRLIIDHRKQLEDKLRQRCLTKDGPPAGASARNGFRITRSPSDPKQRWVDGTPEYSSYICPLRKLFPEARFIHLVRDVDSVVRSILNFERTGGPRLVQNEQQAYQVWHRAAAASRQAEIAYGSEIVRRVRHSDLINHAEATLQELVDFLDETFEPTCLEPLESRINSSDVPTDFDSADPATDPDVIAEAKRLSAELQRDREPLAPSVAEAVALEANFNQRILHAAGL